MNEPRFKVGDKVRVLDGAKVSINGLTNVE